MRKSLYIIYLYVQNAAIVNVTEDDRGQNKLNT